MFLKIFLGAAFIYRIINRIFRKFPGKVWRAPKFLVILGSGGHTAEMLPLVAALKSKFGKSEFVYVSADSDFSSPRKVEGSVLKIRRSREVGQSYLTSIFSTFLAFSESLRIVWQVRPNAILANGPGTCVPAVAAALLLEFLTFRKIAIFFVESFCRVKSLSLTGKILYPVSDEFFVFWKTDRNATLIS